MTDFQQLDWNQRVESDCRAIVRLAWLEDLDNQSDWTTVCLVSEQQVATADIVVREAAIVAGIPALVAALDEMKAEVVVSPCATDGDSVEAGSVLATLHGKARDLLTCERILLNLIARLMGIATMARQYAELVRDTHAQVYDTRKTTPGWRRLEKYAVQCGGAKNHRTGLFDAILIKDNHLAHFASAQETKPCGAGEAVRHVRHYLSENSSGVRAEDFIVEVEVDTLEQLAEVLPEYPHIVLLDNMPNEMLVEAVALRNSTAPQVQLEASGGITLETLRAVAETGIERISMGALTHSVRSLDVGLDWRQG